jgi:HEAT repeat protein
VTRLGIALLVASVGLGAVAPASAVGKSATKPATKPARAKAAPATPQEAAIATSKLEALRQVLFDENEGRALEVAAVLGGLTAPNAGDPLIELLAAGTSTTKAQAALDALGKLAAAGALGSARGMEVLELYSGHRNVELRNRAVKALGALKDPAVVTTLLARLGDEAPEVRATAGEALAARKETRATPRLFALLKRGDAGAATPLAVLATPDLVPQIAELAGSVDDGVLASALGEYVKRTDVPDKLRVDVLRTISHLSGAVATTALVEYVAAVPAKDNRPSKAEALKLLDERGSKQ